MSSPSTAYDLAPARPATGRRTAMTVNVALLRPCVELIIDPAWWYQRLVERYAEAFWLAGDGDRIVRTIETVCLACDVTPLGDSLSRRLVDLSFAFTTTSGIGAIQ